MQNYTKGEIHLPEKTEIKDMSLHEKLAGIRKIVEVVQKNKEGHNYKYAGEETILAKVIAGMDRYGVNLYSEIVPGTMTLTPYSYTKVKALKGGGTFEEIVNEFLVQGELLYTWVNVDNPEDTLSVHWSMIGQKSDASQAVGSGLTYCNRYFLLKFFQDATPKDDLTTGNLLRKPQRTKRTSKLPSRLLRKSTSSLAITLTSSRTQKSLRPNARALPES